MTYTLILLMAVIFTLQYLQPEITQAFAFTPIEILRGQNLHTLLTSIFLHADAIHLLVNMYFFYIFGSILEGEIHPFTYFGLFVFSGIIGGLGHILITVTIEGFIFWWAPFIPTLGASGAIFGIIAAYLYLIPRRRIRVIGGYGEQSQNVLAWNVAILFIIVEVILTLTSFGSGVAHGAHVFGFIGGYIVALIIRRIKDFREKILFFHG